MTDLTQVELEEATAKFISVGNNVFLSSSGKSEVCRKGQQGLFCKRHHGSSLSSQPDLRALLDKHRMRTVEKLSPFENGCIWLYSLFMKMPFEEAQQRYIESTAMYTLLGVKKPTDIEIKGLQKALLGLIESSRVQDTRMDKLKKMVKNMAFGQGFTEAGFYSLKDMTRETLTKIKMGFAGLALGSSLVLTGCAGVQNTPSPTTSETSIVDEQPNQSSYDTSDGRYNAKPESLDGEVSINTAKKTGFQEIFVETRSDEYGSYSVYKLSYPSIDSVSNKGVPTKTLTSALEFYTDFVSTEVLDSIAFDNYDKYDEWVKTVAPKYIDKAYLKDIVNAQNNGQDFGIVFNNFIPSLRETERYNAFPTLYRDGGPRVFNKKIWNITATPVEGNIYISSVGSATIMTDDKNHLAWDVKANGKGFEDYPIFNDGKPASSQITFTVGITLKQDGNSWKIVGYNYTMDSNIADLLEETPEKLINWRNELKK